MLTRCSTSFYVVIGAHVVTASDFLKPQSKLVLQDTINPLFVAPWCSGYHYCTTSFNKA